MDRLNVFSLSSYRLIKDSLLLRNTIVLSGGNLIDLRLKLHCSVIEARHHEWRKLSDLLRYLSRITGKDTGSVDEVSSGNLGERN